jgi:uncharacterized membrane protein
MPESTLPLNHDPNDVETGKMMAVLCYLPISPVNLVLSIVCLVQKNNAFSLYHAKQSMALILVTIVAAAISAVLICVGIGLILYPLVAVGFLVLTILGIVNAAGGKYKPLPLIDGLAAKMFGGIQKA